MVAVTLVMGTTFVRVETRVTGASVAVTVEAIVEVPVATREQILETRDAGNFEIIEGVCIACRGSSQGRVWVVIPVANEVMSVVEVETSVLTVRTVAALGVTVTRLVVIGAL